MPSYLEKLLMPRTSGAGEYGSERMAGFADTLRLGPRLSGMDALQNGQSVEQAVQGSLDERRGILDRTSARRATAFEEQTAWDDENDRERILGQQGTETVMDQRPSLVDSFRSRVGGFDRFPAAPTEGDRERAFARLGNSPLSGSGPGTAAFNNETRGLRRVASLLRRGAREARLSGNYEKAAELTQRALGGGMGTGMTDRDATNQNFATQVQAGYDTGATLSNPIIPGQEQLGAAEGGALGRSPTRSAFQSSDRNRWSRDQWTTRR